MHYGDDSEAHGGTIITILEKSQNVPPSMKVIPGELRVPEL